MTALLSDVFSAAGPLAIAEAADRPADWTMSAIVGAAVVVAWILRRRTSAARWRSVYSCLAIWHQSV